MERQHAIALVMYINRAVGIVPTTGQEWDMIRNALGVIENVANGRVTLEARQPEQQPQQRINGNGRDLTPERPIVEHPQFDHQDHRAR